MRFIDSTLNDSLSRDKIRMAFAVAVVLALSLLMFMGMYYVIDQNTRKEERLRKAQAEELAGAVSEENEALGSESLQEAFVSASDEPLEQTQQEYEEEGPEEGTEDEPSEQLESIAPESEAPALQPQEETSETASETASVQTAETTDPDYPYEYYSVVYAAGDINLRSGPGTEYDVVRVIRLGERIDVTGQTASGWYRTYSGNFVMISLTSQEPVATTATTTAAQTTAQTAAQTAASSAAQTAAASSGMTYYGSCHITYYGPQPLADGSYSTSTATGTTCQEGRTVAADWSIFPAGTVIYIENDPLGGDGYYTVEDRGPGVNGSHIDIYSEGSHVVTDRDVYIVNQ